MESSATTSIDVALPQMNSDHTITEDSNCDPSVTKVNMISSVVIGTNIQEADSPSAPGSSDYGSTDFDYTYGDDRRFIFDGVTQMEDFSKENQDADSGIGTLDWSDQVKNLFYFHIAVMNQFILSIICKLIVGL